MPRLDSNCLSLDKFLFWPKEQIKAVYGKEIDIYDQMYGAVQPVVDILKDMENMAKPYRSGWFIKRDAKQPIVGIKNLLQGIFELLASPLLFLFYAVYYVFQTKNLKAYNEKVSIFSIMAFSWFIHGGLSILRGITQIATTPLTWLIKIPLRGLITLIQRLQGKSFAVEDNPSIQRLVVKIDKLIKENEQPIEDGCSSYKNVVDLITSIHRKYTLGIMKKEQFSNINQVEYNRLLHILLSNKDNNEEVPKKENVANFLGLFKNEEKLNSDISTSKIAILHCKI